MILRRVHWGGWWEKEGGSTVWEGYDEEGMSSYPSGALAVCDDNATWTGKGLVNLKGHLRFYLWFGNIDEMRTPGSALWFAAGTEINVAIKGSFYILGATLELTDAAASVASTSSFSATRGVATMLDPQV